jgi:hypothetical protein
MNATGPGKHWFEWRLDQWWWIDAAIQEIERHRTKETASPDPRTHRQSVVTTASIAL